MQRFTEVNDLFRVKDEAADKPYMRAKHAQIRNDAETAITLFWEAINAGDRVDSAVKDMALLMKNLGRSEEAIEVIKTFRCLCSKRSQESLDNVLLDLYKKSGRLDEQIDLIKRKLRFIYRGDVFNGKPTKTARSHGKKFQVSVAQEISRLLGNMGWAYMQTSNYQAAEVVFKKAQMIDPDANKACNLGFCLIKQYRHDEAFSWIQAVLHGDLKGSENAVSRAENLLAMFESKQVLLPSGSSSMSDCVAGLSLDQELLNGLEPLLEEWAPFRSKRLPIFEEISDNIDQLAR